MKKILILLLLLLSVIGLGGVLAQTIDGALKTLTASGTNTYTISEAFPATYTVGERFIVKFTNGNTGAATLNRNGLGAKAIVKNNNTALASGDIVSGQKMIVSYDGTNYQIVGSVGRQVLTGSATLDFASTAAGASTTLTVTVTGAALNDSVVVGVPNGSISTTNNGIFTGWVSSANTVSVKFTNANLSGNIDPASGTFNVRVIK